MLKKIKIRMYFIFTGNTTSAIITQYLCFVNAFIVLIFALIYTIINIVIV